MLDKTIKKSHLYLILSFAAQIVVGAVLLKSPLVEFKGHLEWLDALFTSTSAVCLVGLTSVPVDSFDLTGQIVLIMLMQLGGLGMMTITASVVLLLRHNFSWQNKKMLSIVNANFPLHNIQDLNRFVILYSLILELTGVMLMFPGFLFLEKCSVGESIHYSFFLSVSAFCNAGFSPLPNSLIGVSTYLKLVVCVLIVCGGLGFCAIYDIVNRQRGMQLQINTKIILVTTLFLIVAGTLAIKGLEWMGYNPELSWIDALFQSITSRTAGFNTVSIPGLGSSTLFVIALLMFIGASPNSTGGGIKTTTFAIVLLSIWSVCRGRDKLILWKREISPQFLLNALAIMMTFIILAIICSVFLATAVDSEMTFKKISFEVVSALTTTGLSLGYTPEAAPYGKMALILCMFLGRLGPFSVFMFLVARTKPETLSYPEEPVNLI